MLAALLLALAAAPPKPASPFHTRPETPPAQLPLTKDARPLLSNPQLNVDGTKIYVGRLPVGAEKTGGLHLTIASTTDDGKAVVPAALDLPVPVVSNDAQILLSPNERTLAALSDGELWVISLDGKGDARRLYPPASGDAPLGPRLTHAAYARDSSWFLIQSPTGWARLSVEKGELGSVPLKPIDLTDGSIALSPDDQHVLLVKRQTGLGYQNGGPVLALTLETGFAQVLDKDHAYLGVLFLPNGYPVGVDAAGALWILKPGGRLSYFTPPAPKAGGQVGAYAIDLGLSTLSWTVTRGVERGSPKAQLWTASAPVPPKNKHEAP